MQIIKHINSHYHSNSHPKHHMDRTGYTPTIDHLR